LILKLQCCKKGEKSKSEKINLGEQSNGGAPDVTSSLMPKDVKVVNGPNGETVATVDEVAGLKYRTSGNGAPDEMATVGMRMMISNNFAPKTRLRMASRLLIMEVHT
jgi:hypothetical protein